MLLCDKTNCLRMYIVDVSVEQIYNACANILPFVCSFKMHKCMIYNKQCVKVVGSYKGRLESVDNTKCLALN